MDDLWITGAEMAHGISLSVALSETSMLAARIWASQHLTVPGTENHVPAATDLGLVEAHGVSSAL